MGWKGGEKEGEKGGTNETKNALRRGVVCEHVRCDLSFARPRAPESEAIMTFQTDET